MKIKLIKKILVGVVAFVLVGVGFFTVGAYADGGVGFSMSPMSQKIVLDPGETYQTSVTISHSNNENDFNYFVRVLPFYVNEDYKTVFEENGGYNQIVDWITLDSPETGTLSPNESRDIYFTINVPEDAPGGGQYATIMVSNASSGDSDEVAVNEVLSIGHLVFAEITGDTVKQGEFESVLVPGFLFSGEIKGTSSIKNTGNTHGEAEYTLQVFPLFSNEEIYTNEEDPETHTIIPDRSYYNETVWSETPAIGIFNVVYKVEFEGVTKEVSKMVIKCPIWLLFVVLAVIAALVIWIVMKIRSGKKKSKKSEE